MNYAHFNFGARLLIKLTVVYAFSYYCKKRRYILSVWMSRAAHLVLQICGWDEWDLRKVH